jgi:hypothetical protein
MNTVFDLDQIAPPGPGRQQTPLDRRISIMLGSLSERRRAEGVRQLVEGLPHSDLSKIEHRTRIGLLAGLRPEDPDAEPSREAKLARVKIYAGFQCPPAFAEQSRLLGSNIATRFLGSGRFDGLDKDWPKLDEDARLDVVAEFLRSYMDESGYAPPSRLETERVEPNADGQILHGGFKPEEDALMFNTHPHAAWSLAVKTLALTGHEQTHNVQQQMAGLLVMEQRPDLVGEKPSGQSLFASSDERLMAWYFFDNKRFGRIEPSDTEIGYKNQPIELHARMVEKAVEQELNRRLVLKLDGGLILDPKAAGFDIDPSKLRTDGPGRKPH